MDVARLRADTPGCHNVIHLNNAGAALQPKPVATTVASYLADEVNYGGYETATARGAELEDFYPAVAELIGADPTELAFVGSATRAWQLIFYSLELAEGDEVITTTTEYHSNFVAYLHLAQRRGFKVVVVPDGPDGELDLAALERSIGGNTRLISLNHMPTNSGLVNPAAEVGAIARARGVPFLLDACQTVGQLPIDVAQIGCDFLTATGRKYMRGPRATGFLYVNQQRLQGLDPVIIDGHAAPWTGRNTYELRNDARRFEVWEQNFAGKAGLGVAARYATTVGSDIAWTRIQLLAEGLRERLALIDGVTVRDRGSVKGGIVSFTVARSRSEDISASLHRGGINTSYSTVAAARIDMEARELEAVVRASVHYYNTEEELDAMAAAVAKLAS